MDDRSRAGAAPLLIAEDLRVRRGGRVVLARCDLRLDPGITVLRGANGSGKSSLLKALAGILSIAAGRVVIAGHDLEAAPEDARRMIGYVPETPDLFPYLSPRELLEVVAELRGGVVDEALEVMAALGLAGREDERIATLSLGQRRKVTIAAAACGAPRVLFLDEPFNGLDVDALAALRALLRGWSAEGRAVLIATHDLAPLGELAVKVVALRDGAVAAT
ncbi:MAG: ABC transporter ATP-binding protein [Myxococcales bacterium]|nr:ABC transporter ATP-binding protein [Myxococcales bacterium]